MARARKEHEIEATGSRLFLELEHDAEKVFDKLFGSGPGPGARKMPRKDFVALWRKNWDTPPRPEWRADELDRFAPRDPKSGARPEAGLKAWNALLKEAFPLGRPADPPPPPPPEMAPEFPAPPDQPGFAPPPSGMAAPPEATIPPPPVQPEFPPPPLA